jgi:hypothetical protein
MQFLTNTDYNFRLEFYSLTIEVLHMQPRFLIVTSYCWLKYELYISSWLAG